MNGTIVAAVAAIRLMPPMITTPTIAVIAKP